MSSLSELWARIEKKAIYGALLLFLVLQLVALFSKPVSDAMKGGGEIVLLAGVLLAVFRFIDIRLGADSRKGLSRNDSFLSDLVRFLAEEKQCETLDIFAHSSNIYYRAVFESKISIGKLRLLVRDMSKLHDVQYPKALKDKKIIQQQVRRALQEWEDLHKEEKRVDSFDVLEYTFEPMMHFCIVDGAKAHLGFYSFQRALPGVRAKNHSTYVFAGDGAAEQSLLRDLSTTFKMNWELLEHENNSDAGGSGSAEDY